jgi:hypothetical protein
MKQIKWFILTLIAGAFTGCGLSSDRGELTGTPGRKAWFHPQHFWYRLHTIRYYSYWFKRTRCA